MTHSASNLSPCALLLLINEPAWRHSRTVVSCQHHPFAMRTAVSPHRSPSPSPPASLSGLFQRVSAQLDSLQPPAKAEGSDAESIATLIPTRGRTCEIIASNLRFRPVEESQRRHLAAAPSTATTPRSSLPGHRRDSCDALALASPSILDHGTLPTAGVPAPTVCVPVGGRARVFQAPDLARAKRGMKKRSNALTNLHATVAAGSAAWELAHGGAASMSLAMSGKQALIAELVRTTSFSTQHIFHMSRKFKEIAGAAKSVISFSEFRQLLSDDVSALLQTIGVGDSGEDAGADMSSIGATISASESFMRRLFQMFDGDGDGRIDFREFVVGLNAFCRGSLEDKVNALFAAYQSNGDTEMFAEPTVAISDVLGLFQGDRQLYQELMRCVDEYFARVSDTETEEATTIGLEDFVAVSLAESTLLETISRPTPSLVFSEDSSLRERLKTFVGRGHNWRTMREIQHRLRSTGDRASTTTDLRMPVSRFLPIVSDSVGAASDPSLTDDLNLLLRPYIVKASVSIDRPGTPSPLLDVPSFLQDLAVVLLHPTALPSSESALDAEAKARYHFELFDLNHDGLVSRSELISAVCAGFAHFGSRLTDVVRVLESEDADQDGQLTKQQYLAAARRSPLILASLYTCL